MAKCAKCGKTCSKWSCKHCHEVSMTEAATEFRKIWATQKCPKCGDTLVPNNSMCDTYWLQCRNFGMNKTNPNKPDCDYQITGLKRIVDQQNSENRRQIIEKLSEPNADGEHKIVYQHFCNSCGADVPPGRANCQACINEQAQNC